MFFWDIRRVFDASKLVRVYCRAVAVRIVLKKWRLVLFMELQDLLVRRVKPRPTTLSRYSTKVHQRVPPPRQKTKIPDTER